MRLKKTARKFEKALGVAKGSTTFMLMHSASPTGTPWSVSLNISGKDDVRFGAAKTPKKAVKHALRLLRSPEKAESIVAHADA